MAGKSAKSTKAKTPKKAGSAKAKARPKAVSDVKPRKPAAIEKPRRPGTAVRKETPPTRNAQVSKSAPVARRVPVEPAPVKVDSGLNRNDLEMFREMLLQKRAQLLGDVTSMQREAFSGNQRGGDLSSMPLHMADLGTDQYEQEFTLGLIEGEQALLREIDDALARIDKGTYGICIGTHQPIGKARLKAQPWAKYSYEFMLAQERGRNRRY